MPTFPTTVTPAISVGEGMRDLLQNLGVTPTNLYGEGELLAAIANAVAGTSPVGGISLAPANTLAQTLPRSGVTSAAIAVATGTLQLEAVYLTQGQVISNITYVSGTTAGATLNHQWGVLATSALSVVAVSADGTSGAIAASTAITYAFGTPYVVPTTGIYYAGIMVSNNSGTQPSFSGTTAIAATNNVAPKIGGTSNTSATTPPALAATLTAITGTAGIIYIYLT